MIGFRVKMAFLHFLQSFAGRASKYLQNSCAHTLSHFDYTQKTIFVNAYPSVLYMYVTRFWLNFCAE